MAAAVVVAVGREVDGVPVGLDRWLNIREAAAWTVQGQPGGTVFTRDALGHGQWDGRSEESVTVAGEVDARGVAGVLEAAGALCREHAQEAIAVTVGVTVLVGLGTSLPVSVRLRLLAEQLEAAGL